MRKITQQIAEAWAFNKPKKLGNSETTGNQVFLHNNLIAWKDTDPLTYNFTLAGWATNTTRERLNGLLDAIHANGCGFFQRKGKQYFTDLKGETREIASKEVITIKF